MSPMVSVLIPTYNSFEYLRTCSLPSVLAQTHQDYEVLIANEGHDPKVLELISKIGDARIKYCEYEERTYSDQYNRWCTGGAHGINMLLDRAEGKYIAHLDHDDIWFPHALEKRIEVLEHSHDIDFVYGKAFRSLSRQWFGSEFKGEHNTNTLHHFTVLYRYQLREVKYLETGRSPVDYNRWYRIYHARKYNMHFLDAGIGIYNEGKTPEKTPFREINMLYEHLVGVPIKVIGDNT